MNIVGKADKTSEKEAVVNIITWITITIKGALTQKSSINKKDPTTVNIKNNMITEFRGTQKPRPRLRSQSSLGIRNNSLSGLRPVTIPSFQYSD